MSGSRARIRVSQHPLRTTRALGAAFQCVALRREPSDGVEACHERFSELVPIWADLLLQGRVPDDFVALYAERAMDLAFALRSEGADDMAVMMLESVLADLEHTSCDRPRCSRIVLAQTIREVASELLGIYTAVGDTSHAADLRARCTMRLRDLLLDS